jgi:hypothetical protein
MKNIKVPKELDFGFGKVVDIEYLEFVLGISRQTAKAYLKAFHINPHYIGKYVVFSLVTFQRILYVVSKPGAKGFLFPSSTGKCNQRLRDNKNFIMEVTPEILEEAMKPEILAEMAICAGTDDALLRKFAGGIKKAT